MPQNFISHFIWIKWDYLSLTISNFKMTKNSVFARQATPAMSTSRISILSLNVEVIVHYQQFFSIFLCISNPSMSKRVNNGYLEVIFHALDIFSIIFASVNVEVKIGTCMGAILSASTMYMINLRCEHLPNNNKKSMKVIYLLSIEQLILIGRN